MEGDAGYEVWAEGLRTFINAAAATIAACRRICPELPLLRIHVGPVGEERTLGQPTQSVGDSLGFLVPDGRGGYAGPQDASSPVRRAGLLSRPSLAIDPLLLADDFNQLVDQDMNETDTEVRDHYQV